MYFSGDPSNSNTDTDQHGYREERESEISRDTAITYNLKGGVEELKRFIEFNNHTYIEPHYGNTLLHLLVHDLAFFQSNFGNSLSDQELREKMKILKIKIDKICYFLENYGYPDTKNKKQFTVIETLLYALPIFSKINKKNDAAIKAEEKLTKILAKLLVYACIDSDTICNQICEKLRKKGYLLAANSLKNEIKKVCISGKEFYCIFDQDERMQDESYSSEADISQKTCECIEKEYIEDIMNVDEENPLYIRIEKLVKPITGCYNKVQQYVASDEFKQSMLSRLEGLSQESGKALINQVKESIFHKLISEIINKIVKQKTTEEIIINKIMEIYSELENYSADFKQSNHDTLQAYSIALQENAKQAAKMDAFEEGVLLYVDTLLMGRGKTSLRFRPY